MSKQRNEISAEKSAEPQFSIDELKKSKRFKDDIYFLSALDSEKKYTLDEAQKAVSELKKRKVGQ